jgi:hypothetical protein
MSEQKPMTPEAVASNNEQYDLAKDLYNIPALGLSDFTSASNAARRLHHLGWRNGRDMQTALSTAQADAEKARAEAAVLRSALQDISCGCSPADTDAEQAAIETAETALSSTAGDALLAELARLREAVKPFAEYAKQLTDRTSDELELLNDGEKWCCVGDLRKAARALEGGE